MWSGLLPEVERIEAQIESLGPDDLAKFRCWFLEFDAQVWDRKLDVDARSGKLDSLLAEARAEYAAGQAREL